MNLSRVPVSFGCLVVNFDQSYAEWHFEIFRMQTTERDILPSFVWRNTLKQTVVIALTVTFAITFQVSFSINFKFMSKYNCTNRSLGPEFFCEKFISFTFIVVDILRFLLSFHSFLGAVWREGRYCTLSVSFLSSSGFWTIDIQFREVSLLSLVVLRHLFAVWSSTRLLIKC